MKLKTLVLAGLTFVAACGAAGAQVAPYAMFSAGHYSGLGVGAGTAPTVTGGETSLGGTFGLNDDFIHIGPVALGGDIRGMVQNSANSTQYGNKLAGLLAGPRITANTVVLPFRPYAQVEIGAIGTNSGRQTNKTFISATRCSSVATSPSFRTSPRALNTASASFPPRTTPITPSRRLAPASSCASDPPPVAVG